MAKGNVFMGQLRGAIGDVVFSRQNGQQVSRSRNRRPANPQTEGQTIQRMLISTISYAYSGLKSIVDHSFEGRKYGQECMTEFMSRNLNLLRADAAKVNASEKPSWRYAFKGIRTTYPNLYVLSAGSLTPVDFTLETAKPNGQGANRYAFPSKVIAGATAEALTLRNLMNVMGANAGDQFTFVTISADESSDPLYSGYGDSNDTVFPMNVAVRRIKFRDSYTNEELNTLVSAAGFNAIAFDGAVTNDDVKVELTSEAGDGGVSFNLGISFTTLEFKATGLQFLAGGVIRSRKSADAWLRSNSQMKYSEIMDDSYLGGAFVEAFDQWMSGGDAIGASSYILNAKPNTGFEFDEP